MHRKTSPIRHDYIEGAARPRGRRGAPRLPWFAVGVGVPLACVALLISRPAAEPAQDAGAPVMVPVAAPARAPNVQQPGERLEPAARAIVAAALLAAPPPPLAASVTLEVGPGDTLDGLFREHELSIADLLTISALEAAKQPLRMLRPGATLTVTHDEGRILSVTRHLDLFSTLAINRSDDGQFDAQVVERPVEYRRTVHHGRIDTTLFEAAADVGLADKVIMNMAGIFAWDIDFVYDIRTGDEFFVMHEELWRDGEKVADGEIVAAEFINQGEAYQAIRFVGPNERSDYFDPTGRSVRKAFVRAPIDFARVSSNFNPNRLHPVLNTVRPHRGVDYAAPVGTPIMAAGDGKIIFRGRQRGYGNVVILQHGGNITTLYAHMNNFRKGQRVGTRVRQGQVIGFLGATGMVTGPHLHYEYRLNGVHRNPRTVKLPQAEPIKAEYRQEFEQLSAPIWAEMEAFKERIRVASATGEGGSSTHSAF